MQGFIPAAGKGTRLKPFTDKHPKALFPFGESTLLEIAIRRLEALGIGHIVINTHHFSTQIETYLKSKRWEADIAISDESEQLMDTGGGLKKASKLLSPNEPVMVHNVDILSTIDLSELIQVHQQSQAMATLAVSERETSRGLLFDRHHQLVGWHNSADNQYIWCDQETDNYQKKAFSGIYIIEPRLIDQMRPADTPYPIIPELLRIGKDNPINYYMHRAEEWMDVGKSEKIADAQQFFQEITAAKAKEPSR